MEQTTWKRSVMEKSCSVVLEFSFHLSNIGDVTLIRCRVCSQGKNAGSRKCFPFSFEKGLYADMFFCSRSLHAVDKQVFG